MTELKLRSGSGLVIVAHPDDETIWMGGTILSFPHVRWTIFSLCRGDDLDRAPRFKKACRLYGARAIISDLEDEGVMNIQESIAQIARRIAKLVPRRRFDYLVTHGYNGEYGHPRHKGVYRAVYDLVRRKKLRAEKVFTFAYHLDERKGYARPDARSDFLLALSEKTFRAKQRIITDLYGFTENSFECRSASARETFRSLNI